MKYFRLKFDGEVVFKAEDRPKAVEFKDIELSDYGRALGVWSGDEKLEEISKEEFVKEIQEMCGEVSEYVEDE
jgi:hypothetical protein